MPVQARFAAVALIPSKRKALGYACAVVLAFLAALFAVQPSIAAEGAGHRMVWDSNGMIMGENKGDELPIGCDKISGDIALTIQVGREYAPEGYVFGYSSNEWQAPPCSRITVKLINHDEVRHMWMLHGLPSYLYFQGMFHLEVNGGREMTGTFIAPPDDKTYFVHCDIAQHTEKGLKGQLKVGKGSGDLPSIPGITPPLYRGEG